MSSVYSNSELTFITFIGKVNHYYQLHFTVPLKCAKDNMITSKSTRIMNELGFWRISSRVFRLWKIEAWLRFSLAICGNGMSVMDECYKEINS